MQKKQSIMIVFFLLTVGKFIYTVERDNILRPVNNNVNDQPIIELLNNTDTSIVVNQKTVKPGKVIRIPFNIKSCLPICTIKEFSGNKSRKYQVVFKWLEGDSLIDQSSLVSLDFETIRFIALLYKDQFAYDEILVNNDTPYDIFVCFINRNIKNVDSYDCKKNGIAIAPGNTFHKTVHCTSIKSGSKTKKAIGRLLFSVMNTENNEKIYSVFYPRRLYTHASLVGLAGWKKGKISAQTIKLFDKFFNVECI